MTCTFSQVFFSKHFWPSSAGITTFKKLTRSSNKRVTQRYSVFLRLHTISKLGLYMNSRYWAKTIKFLNLTNSVYNLRTMALKLKNLHQNYLLREKAFWQVITRSPKPCEARDSRHVVTWAREIARNVDT